ncbi:toxin-antitoxin system YwqK family antitoxin [Flavobacterium sp.]|uniref:toxin-antitoxin system YwqK family antitoxin n=1 Tax=Flavobacterium sp. TaxID=239 RepID=UPI003C500393
MKKYIVLVAVFVSVITFANETKPKLEATKDNIVKATYYHENGQVQQQGAFKNGKLHGEWVSYDENGNKIAIAEYNNGAKVGKWFLWNDSSLNEVDYTANKIVAVKNWKKEAVVTN